MHGPLLIVNGANLKASRPSEHPSVGGNNVKCLGGIISCKDKTSCSTAATSYAACMIYGFCQTTCDKEQPGRDVYGPYCCKHCCCNSVVACAIVNKAYLKSHDSFPFM